MLDDLKKFLIRGNVVDLAVAVIIGSAFGKIVTSFVKDVVMPPIGYALGGVDFSDLAYVLAEKTEDAAAVTIKYGAFIQTIIDFVIVGTVIFFVVKIIEKMQKKKEEVKADPKPAEDVVLLTEIRDLLKKK